MRKAAQKFWVTFGGVKKVLHIEHNRNEARELGWTALPLSEENAPCGALCPARVPLLGFAAGFMHKIRRGLRMDFHSTGKGREQGSPQITGECQHKQVRSALCVQMRRHRAPHSLPRAGFASKQQTGTASKNTDPLLGTRRIAKNNTYLPNCLRELFLLKG